MEKLIEYIVVTVILVGFFFYFRKQTKAKSKSGINLNSIYCPTCGEKQPMVRFPKNVNQALYGGNICNNCKTEMDKYGQKI